MNGDEDEDRPRWRKEGRFLLLSVPYNQDFLYEFKNAIPPRYRIWHAGRVKYWRVADLYRDDVHRLVLAFFGVDLGVPEPSRREREGRNGDPFDAPDPGRMRTPDGIAALREQLQAQRAKNAQLDLQNRLLRQTNATLQSQLAMAQAGRPSPNGAGGDFTLREFIRVFGARGFKSLIRTCHPDVVGPRLAAEADRYAKEITKMADEVIPKPKAKEDAK